jgi:16S rRNA (uracil1498-N3)-methyltransferase
MMLFYHPLAAIGQTLQLDAEESKHLRAARIGDGQQLWLTNGCGLRLTCSMKWNQKTAEITALSEENIALQKPLLTLAVAPTKNTDRTEWLVEKAIEIGVHRIVLLECEHSERTFMKHERLQRLAIAAMKQSQRYWLPVIEGPIQAIEFFNMPFSGQKLVAHCAEDSSKNTLVKTYQPKENALICIGPEGDFSTKEIAAAKAQNFQTVSLGEARLRTETAGLVAVTTFHTLNT